MELPGDYQSTTMNAEHHEAQSKTDLTKSSLTENEKELLRLAKEDDLARLVLLLEVRSSIVVIVLGHCTVYIQLLVHTVYELYIALQKYPETDVNVSDMRRHTALQLAIENHNMDMVRHLLEQPKIRQRDAQLYAVREQQLDILELLLDWESRYTYCICGIYIHSNVYVISEKFQNAIQPDHNLRILLSSYRKRLSGVMELPVFESAEFPSYMTPLMLACIENCFEIVQMLIQKGYDVMLPDDDIGKNLTLKIVFFKVFQFVYPFVTFKPVRTCPFIFRRLWRIRRIRRIA